MEKHKQVIELAHNVVAYQRWGREPAEETKNKEMVKMAKYKVELNSVGNPDRGQNPLEQIDGAWANMAHVDSIDEASRAVREYIEKHNLGAGNWAGGKVWTEDNQYLGYISYNGRFWEGRTV